MGLLWLWEAQSRHQTDSPPLSSEVAAPLSSTLFSTQGELPPSSDREGVQGSGPFVSRYGFHRAPPHIGHRGFTRGTKTAGPPLPFHQLLSSAVLGEKHLGFRGETSLCYTGEQGQDITRPTVLKQLPGAAVVVHVLLNDIRRPRSELLKLHFKEPILSLK